MKTLFFSIILTATAALPALAQNSIDHYVESASTMGSSKFTTVVERDPQTGQVQRVIKVRELQRGIDIDECYETFQTERRSGTYSTSVKQHGGVEYNVVTLTVSRPKQERIYMLQYAGPSPFRGRDGCVTIVIKMKQ